MNLEPETVLNQQNEDANSIHSGEFYIRAVSQNQNVDLPRTESFNSNSTSKENNTATKPQSNEQKGNNNLNKVLLGGLLGATLGTLAAALANKKNISRC